TTRQKKFSATSMPCCMRLPTEGAIPTSYASTFRACPFQKEQKIFNVCLYLGGNWSKHTYSVKCLGRDWPNTLSRVTTWLSSCAICQTSRQFRSTSASASHQYRMKCGIFRLAVTRCSTNI